MTHSCAHSFYSQSIDVALKKEQFPKNLAVLLKHYRKL